MDGPNSAPDFQQAGAAPEFEPRLYVAGHMARSLAAGDQILAVPTLVRRLPEPIEKIIGDLSNQERVLVGLDIHPRNAGPS